MRTGSILILAAILFAGLASIAHAQQNTPMSLPPDPPGTAATGGGRGTAIDGPPLSAPARANNGTAISGPAATGSGPDTGAALRSVTPRDSTVGTDPSSPSSGR
jgi:hypothetical protein